MKDKLVASGFFKIYEDKELCLKGYEFVPPQCRTLEEAKKKALKFFAVSPSTVLFLELPDGSFTFVPIAGDARTMIGRTAKACGAKVLDETVCIKL